MKSINPEDSPSDLLIRNALPETIVTGRLVLRQPNHADVPEMARLANNKAIFQVLARLPHPYSEADAVHFVETVATGEDERVYAITWRDAPNKDTYLGSVGFHLLPGKLPELGYWLGEPHWGQGVMSEAVGALLGAARATGKFPRIAAKALATNAGSLKILENSGFVRTGSRISDLGHNTGKTVIELMLEARP